MSVRLPVLFLPLFMIATVLWSTPAEAARETEPVIFHVKTALSVDDAQICVVPNIAWAALAEGRPVVVVFDGSAVTSLARGYGWRGWLGSESTAMDRASLPGRERDSLARQFGVPLGAVPRDYGEYLRFIKNKGAKVFYNATMAVLYEIPPEKIDDVATPLQLRDVLRVLEAPGTYLVY